MSRPSRARAVRAKCAECIHDPQARGSELQQITACTSTTCPLYDVRPLSTVSPDVIKWVRYETDVRPAA